MLDHFLDLFFAPLLATHVISIMLSDSYMHLHFSELLQKSISCIRPEEHNPNFALGHLTIYS